MINFQLAGWALVIIWLFAVSFFVLHIYIRYMNIFKDSQRKSILEVLDKLTKDYHLAEKEILSLTTKVAFLEEENIKNFRKVGLIRFNPFNDTGGEQSFIVALLDIQNSGIVISGLYARSGMRWYVKKIKEGKGVEHELSEEERKAVESAK